MWLRSCVAAGQMMLAAPIQPPGWELSYTTGAALKSQKEEEEEKKKKLLLFLNFEFENEYNFYFFLVKSSGVFVRTWSSRN